jgi:hypothetical protein
MSTTYTTQDFDLEIFQGETYTVLVEEYQDDADPPVVPLPNTGFAAKLQIRASSESDVVLVELTDAGGITLGGANGHALIRIGADKTRLLIEGAAYDLRLTEIADPTNVRYPISGAVILSRRVTRDA